MSDWTDERVETLRRMWRDGFSASLIAAKIGVSRNAVIGKARRIHLAEHINVRNRVRGPRKPYNRRKSQPMPITTQPVSAAPEPPVAVQEPVDPVTIEQLRFPISQCRHIAGEASADALYCGARTRPGSSWCPQHHARMWLPRKSREHAA